MIKKTSGLLSRTRWRTWYVAMYHTLCCLYRSLSCFFFPVQPRASSKVSLSQRMSLQGVKIPSTRTIQSGVTEILNVPEPIHETSTKTETATQVPAKQPQDKPVPDKSRLSRKHSASPPKITKETGKKKKKTLARSVTKMLSKVFLTPSKSAKPSANAGNPDKHDTPTEEEKTKPKVPLITTPGSSCEETLRRADISRQIASFDYELYNLRKEQERTLMRAIASLEREKQRLNGSTRSSIFGSMFQCFAPPPQYYPYDDLDARMWQGGSQGYPQAPPPPPPSRSAWP